MEGAGSCFLEQLWYCYVAFVSLWDGIGTTSRQIFPRWLVRAAGFGRTFIGLLQFGCSWFAMVAAGREMRSFIAVDRLYKICDKT